MNENKQENVSQKTNVQQIKFKSKNTTSNKSSKKGIKKQIENFQLFVCLKGCFHKLRISFGLCLSKCSLMIQFLLFLVPFSLIMYFSIYILHYFAFERIFKFDFFYVVENEYLSYLISDIDDIHLEVSSKEIRSQFEDIDNLYFFEIYFQELTSMGLLDEDPSQKIFPNISHNSDNYYKIYDEFQIDNNINSIYTIPKEEAEKYIDNREDCLSEIAKIYYYFLPIITYEAITKKTYINETFLIAYEYDEVTKEIKGDNYSYLYFSYPVKINELEKKNCFYPSDIYMSPQISKTKMEVGEKFNDSFYKDNWFIQQDYNYRVEAGANKICSLIFSNINYNYFGKLNKSNIVSLQSHFNSNITNKTYIINIIYFINQKEFKEELLEFSSFLLFNDSEKPFEIQKYSDNDSFLVADLNVAELNLLSFMNEYFHYGMYDKNYNFFKYGVSFDILDLELLAEPHEYYKSLENFNIDLKYFSSLYLYSSLFRKLEYNVTTENSKELNEIDFSSKENIIQNICEKINFTSYLNYLDEEKINCFDDNNLLYYSEKEAQKDIFKFNYNTMPFCICLPLYCLKNLEKDYKYKDKNKHYKIKIAEKMILPDKCQNNFKNYLNGINENYKEPMKEYSFSTEFDFFFNNINILSVDLKNNIEEEFYIYKSFILPQIPKIIFMIVTLVDNSSMKQLLSALITRIDSIKTYYILIELIGIFVAFIIGIGLVLMKITNISKVIFDFQKIHENFLYKIKSNNQEINISKNEKEDFKINSDKKLEKINYSNDQSLTKVEKSIFKDDNIYNYYFSNDNSLLDELSEIYRNYYKMTKEKLIKIYHESKAAKDEKVEIIENELFKILRIISFYVFKFKLNASMDYNFYLNTKLNLNFLKSIPKGEKSKGKQIQLTQSVIYELLSTEKIENCGLITNFNFRYITNINCNKDNNSIKKSMFNFIDLISNNNAENYSYNKETLIEGENKNDNIQIIWKEKDRIMEEFENNFENDDYLKKCKINLAFNTFLTNAYYKYIKKILYVNNSSSFEFEEKFE